MGQYMDMVKAFKEKQAKQVGQQSERLAVSPAPQSGPRRAFLHRPLGQENNSNPWDAWAPFLNWLLVHYPERLRIILDAEEDILALEQSGIVEGEEYDAACAELFWRFEEARRLKLRESAKVWIQ